MNRSLFLTLLLCFLFLPAGLQAQLSDDFGGAHGDFFRLYFPDKTEFELSYLYEPDHKVKDGSGKFSLNDFTFEGDVPYPLSPDLFFIFGGKFDLRQYSFSDLPEVMGSTSSLSLYTLELSPGVGYFASPDLLFTGVVDLGIYTDFSSSGTFDLQGDARLIYRMNPTAQLVFGLRASNEFEDIPLFPVLGIRLLSGDGRIHLDATFPLELEVSYRLTPQWTLYAGGWINGDEYKAKLGSPEQDVGVYVRDQRLGLGCIYWWKGRIKVGFELGGAIGSVLQFDVPNAGESSGDLDNAFYLSTYVGFAM